ncbi:MAG: beta-N-acetylhexosaminidase [Anaerolineaceae bacterium]|nr:MAG: beta-N-acetylhexosaminidase [Anaerolineaceae bacterium]
MRNRMTVPRALSTVLLAAFLLSAVGPAVPARAAGDFQAGTPESLAQELLDQMTPEERVGQLFLVTFTGSSAGPDTQVYDLVTRHHIGGVALLAGNDNFVDAPDTAAGAYQLIAALQTANRDYASAPVTTAAGEQVQFNYVPLFIGISQDGDGYPNDQVLSGLTPLPDPMALGAAWDTALAEQTGAVAGQELSAVGFNLYFGPPLDVLEFPGASTGSGLGATVFGGDPFWVGTMGQSYISGLHTGSGGRMAVIAKHFPGRGSADRPSGDEVATVRKPLEALKQIELAPFFAVTGSASTPAGTADGLLVSHIRYQGFQGNIRATTRPVSFDSAALSLILSLPAFSSWREADGLMVSDDLGSNTVRRFYESNGAFPARQVVKDAFLAGNDLLYLGNIVSTDQPDSYNTVVQIVEFFAQKYREDPAFARRVDDSALRILTLKYRMYGDFNLDTVIPPESGLETLGQSESVTFDVARRSATLISPDSADIANVLPNPPGARDQIVFLTDTRSQKQCGACAEKPVIAVDALQNAVLRLYGPQGAGLVYSSRMASYSFSDISAILPDGPGGQALETDLFQAEWVVISMLDSDPDQPDFLLRRFLSERQDLLRSKNVILFAFNAPYYLDATDISKLTAYYGLYSKSAPFVEIAARILFQEVTPSGALPVSVPGIGYDLLSATAPDPDQVIGLFLDLPPVPPPTALVTPEPSPTPSFRVGDTITIRTGPLLDHNGHPVPDGTGVRFTLTQSGSNDIIQQVDSITMQGVAKASFSIERSGLLEVRASSDPAAVSVVLQIDITSEGSVSVTALAPTPAAGDITPTPEAAATPAPGSSPLTTGRPGFGGWLLMLAALAGLGFGAYRLGGRLVSIRWGVRWALCLALGGLAAYSYLAFGLPGGAAWMMEYGFWGILGVALAGALTGLGAGWLWRRIEKR